MIISNNYSRRDFILLSKPGFKIHQLNISNNINNEINTALLTVRTEPNVLPSHISTRNFINLEPFRKKNNEIINTLSTRFCETTRNNKTKKLIDFNLNFDMKKIREEEKRKTKKKLRINFNEAFNINNINNKKYNEYKDFILNEYHHDKQIENDSRYKYKFRNKISDFGRTDYFTNSPTVFLTKDKTKFPLFVKDINGSSIIYRSLNGLDSKMRTKTFDEKNKNISNKDKDELIFVNEAVKDNKKNVFLKLKNNNILGSVDNKNYKKKEYFVSLNCMNYLKKFCQLQKQEDDDDLNEEELIKKKEKHKDQKMLFNLQKCKVWK